MAVTSAETLVYLLITALALDICLTAAVLEMLPQTQTLADIAQINHRHPKRRQCCRNLQNISTAASAYQSTVSDLIRAEMWQIFEA